MGRRRIGIISVTAAMISAATFLAPGIAAAQSDSTALVVKMRVQRTSPSDLEIGGDLAGLPAGTTRYITREDLLALPQVSSTVTDDSNFSGPTKVSGVLLEELSRELSAAQRSNMVVAICDDKYQANYPADYLSHHHPVLVLEVNGKPPAGWPKDSSGHGFDMGPYMISHAKFAPRYKILSHAEEAQIPWGVVRIEFRDDRVVFGTIAPRGPRESEPVIQAGYKIAQQNCFRCHNSGAEGGQKSGVTWNVLAAMAMNSADFFAAYVRDPRAKNPQAQMPGRPDYDDATMRALRDYFRAWSTQEKP